MRLGDTIPNAVLDNLEEIVLEPSHGFSMPFVFRNVDSSLIGPLNHRCHAPFSEKSSHDIFQSLDLLEQLGALLSLRRKSHGISHTR